MALQHADDTNDNEWNREYLSHINGQRSFEGFLYFLGVFDEEAEREDVCQTETEVPAGANL